MYFFITFLMANIYISLATINVHGIRDLAKCGNVLNWMQLFKFDVIFLQETYLCTDDFTYFKTIWDGPVFYSPAVSSHSCGVAIAFSSKLRCKFSQVNSDNVGRCISVICTFSDSYSIRFCNVYAPCSPKERVSFLKNLFFYTRGRVPLFVGGDFNCIMSKEDRSGHSLNTSCFVGREEIKSFLQSCNLSDCWLRGFSSGGHTWKHSGKGLSSRIDRLYLPNHFCSRKPAVFNFPFSDHDVLNVEVAIPIGNALYSKGYWKCNTSILDDHVFVNAFKTYYNLWRTLMPGFDTIVE